MGLVLNNKTLLYLSLLPHIIYLTEWFTYKTLFLILNAGYIDILLLNISRKMVYLGQSTNVQFSLKTRLTFLINIIDIKPIFTHHLTLKNLKYGECLNINFKGSNTGIGYLIGLELRITTPLKIYQTRYIVYTPVQFFIYPILIGQNILENSVAAGSIRSTHSISSGLEFNELKEFTSNDSVRNISWKHSTNEKLYIKMYTPEVKVPFFIYLDCDSDYLDMKSSEYNNMEQIVLSLVQLLITNQHPIVLTLYYRKEYKSLSYPGNSNKIESFINFLITRYENIIQNTSTNRAIYQLLYHQNGIPEEVVRDYTDKDLVKVFKRTTKNIDEGKLLQFLRYHSFDNNKQIERRSFLYKNRYNSTHVLLEKLTNDLPLLKNDCNIYLFSDLKTIGDGQFIELKSFGKRINKTKKPFSLFHTKKINTKEELLDQMKHLHEFELIDCEWEKVSSKTINIIKESYSKRYW